MIMGLSMTTTSTLFYIAFLTIAAFHNCFCDGSSNIVCLETERQALLNFKHDLKDLSNRLFSWTGQECCQWAGVVCDNLTGHVHEIHLRNPYGNYGTQGEYETYLRNMLGGKINPSLLDLKHLRHLDLSRNDFEGAHIPNFIGSIGSLRYLNLSYAGFSGIIPHQLGNLSMLRYLGLCSVFDVYGELELRDDNLQWLPGLISLQQLDIRQVNLSKASNWLQVINTLPSLVELHLSSCELNYVSPSININFTLAILDLSNNNFESPIPRWIFSMSSLVSLDISGCNFYGSIPSGLQNMTSLRVFDASINNLNSTIPEGLFNLSGLISLRLGFNNIHGPIPIGLLNMTSLRDIYFPGNAFESNFPNWLYSFSRLESLNLGGNLLQGVISNAIGNLTSLLSLDLSFNQLEGRIPRSLGNLCKLKQIALSRNNFDGEVAQVIRSFSRCMSNGLEWVELECNYLLGHLPDQLGQFKNLAYFSIHGNFISGPIPMSIGRLSSLITLDLSNNQLNGTPPQSLGQLAKLERLYISYNLLKGVVYDIHFANLTRLYILDASGNSLTFKASDSWIPPFQIEVLRLSSWQLGPQFPLWLQSQGKLHELAIASTVISDSMPTWFWSKPSAFVYLNLSNNQILGAIPRILNARCTIDMSSNNFSGQLPLIPFNVGLIDLSKNSFSGSIYHMLCGTMDEPNTILRFLNLGDNFLSGRIPDCWKNWPSLVSIKLENNNLRGAIPQSMGNLNFLQSLHLRNNKLSGELPQSLQQCKKLLIIDLSENEFIGNIPTWLGNSFSELIVPNVRSNKFQGDIPHELCCLSSLQILDLAHNNISGPVPRCFNNFSAMAKKQNSSGDISYIEGRIPEHIGDMGLLESLDFSLNQLWGEIPLSMSSLTFLSHLNLSYNNLIGQIPLSTQLQSLDNSSFVGNNLCGPPLANCDSNMIKPKVGHSGNEEEEGFPEVWFFAIVALGFVVGFWTVGLTGPEQGPVPGPTGSTGRSGLGLKTMLPFFKYRERVKNSLNKPIMAWLSLLQKVLVAWSDNRHISKNTLKHLRTTSIGKILNTSSKYASMGDGASAKSSKKSSMGEGANASSPCLVGCGAIFSSIEDLI
ncbi:hypothetical protein ACSBR1_008061 [Camellia fascicularis]